MAQVSEKEICMLKAAKFSLLCNVFLFILKGSAIFLVNSLAIAADLGITVVGLTVSVILYYSIKLSNRPADYLCNYGYTKIEHVCEAMEGIVLIGIALAMSFQAFMNLFRPEVVPNPWIGFGCSVISATLNFVGAQYIFKMAKKSSSPAIQAEGVHYQLEGFISGTIALAFTVSISMKHLGFEAFESYVDPLATLLVSIMITIPSVKLARHAFFNLLDASIEEGGKLELMKLLGQYMHRCCEFKDIKTRISGRKKFIEIKVILPHNISLKQGHKVVHSLQQGISSQIAESEVMIQTEPCDGNCAFSQKNQRCPYLPENE
ncbi:MAG: cation diffusion facilitator family transporter [Candidatus Omnitrophota bacterium]